METDYADPGGVGWTDEEIAIASGVFVRNK